MERKKSKYIGDNILLYVENLEENTSIRINIKLAEEKTNTLKVNHILYSSKFPLAIYFTYANVSFHVTLSIHLTLSSPLPCL